MERESAELNSVMQCHLTVWLWVALFPSLNSSFLFSWTKEHSPPSEELWGSKEVPQDGLGGGAEGAPQAGRVPTLTEGRTAASLLGGLCVWVRFPSEDKYILKSIGLEDCQGFFQSGHSTLSIPGKLLPIFSLRISKRKGTVASFGVP